MYEEEVESKMMREVERDREEGRGLAGSQQRVERGGEGVLVGAYSKGGRASLLMASPRGPN